MRDGSGLALVRTSRATVVAEPRAVSNEGDRPLRWLRSQSGHSRFLGLLPRRFAFSETALTPGAEVVVLGRCTAAPAVASDGPYREGAEPTITIEAEILSWS